jgi:hypothetical protein
MGAGLVQCEVRGGEPSSACPGARVLSRGPEAVGFPSWRTAACAEMLDDDFVASREGESSTKPGSSATATNQFLDHK